MASDTLKVELPTDPPNLMIALGLRRTIVSLLAVALLSSQLAASIPGTCGCSDSAAVSDVHSCCVDTFESNVSNCCSNQESDSNCLCGNKCGELSKPGDCVCGCDDSDEKQAPADGKDRTRVGENATSVPVNAPWLLTHRPGHYSYNLLDSGCCDRISAQILLCVWLI